MTNLYVFTATLAIFMLDCIAVQTFHRPPEGAIQHWLLLPLVATIVMAMACGTLKKGG